MRPTHSSYLRVRYYGVVDRGFGPDKVDQGGRTAGAEGVAAFPRGFRGVLNYNYLSSVVFREAFAQSYTEAVNSEVLSSGFLTRNAGALRFNVLLSQAENFQSRTPGDTVRLRALPSMELNSVERPLLASLPFLISWDSAAGWLSRREPALIDTGLRTAFLERLQFHPRLTLPLHWKGLHLAPSIGFKADHYGKSLAAGAPGDERRLTSNSWQRSATTIAVEFTPPALSRLYTGAGALAREPFRHVIEPRVVFRSVNDAGDVRRALWFDSRDLMADTTELEYSLTNRIFTKGYGAGSREVLSWELRQQYYFDPEFGGALRAGRRNVLPSSLFLSGHAYLDGPRRFSPVASLFRFRPSGSYDIEMRHDYDPLRHRLVQGGLTGSARWREAFLSVNHSFVRSSPVLAAPSNQMGFTLGYGNSLRRGWNAAFSGAYDVRAGFLQFTAFQGSYNNDCCGVSVEFRRFALGPSRNENQFRIAFSLANIGTFGNLKKQERLF
jgi:LPS-assembly protein